MGNETRAELAMADMRFWYVTLLLNIALCVVDE
jgi:hypothetical protein